MINKYLHSEIKINYYILILLFFFFLFISKSLNLINFFPWYLRFDPDSILLVDLLAYNSNENEAFFQHPGYGFKFIYGLSRF